MEKGGFIAGPPGAFSIDRLHLLASRARLARMPIQTLATLADIDAAEWDALLPPAQPFLRHAFLSALEDSHSVTPATGWRPAHRVLRDPQGRCAALPAM